MSIDRTERLAQVSAELEALEAHMAEYERAQAKLERNRLGRLVVQHAGARDEALEFAEQLELRVGLAEAGSTDRARYQAELDKQRAIHTRETAAVEEALRAGGFANETEARAARLSVGDIEALEHQVNLFAERYNATLQRYLDLGGTLESF